MSISLAAKEKIAQIQTLLDEAGFDGFLLYIINDQDQFAKRLLEIDASVHISRRFFYFIPTVGIPIKIVNRVDCFPLRGVYGVECSYLGHLELVKALKKNIPKKICMQYSPMADLASHSVVDAGTIELLRSLSIYVSSSQEIIQKFESHLTLCQVKEHFLSANMVDSTAKKAIAYCRDEIKGKGCLYEGDVQQFIMEEFYAAGFVFEGKPICAVNENSANPHYHINTSGCKITGEDYLLIDLWAKRDVKEGVYADITRVACFGAASKRQLQVFEWVRQAQRKAVQLIESRFSSGEEIFGYEVDKICFDYLSSKGAAKAIYHRTGHSITGQLHGPGVNFDNLETIDKRPLIKGSCYSVEPALYFEGEFGLRLEHDVLIDEEGIVHVTGGTQNTFM